MEAETEIVPNSRGELKKTVSVLHLVSISYFLVSAGPFGQEEAISAGGALYTFIAILGVPLVYSLPLALISSEQASRLPACGGAVEWGLVLGRPMAFVNCYVRFVRSVFDNALYPVMIYDYLAAIIPKMDRWWAKMIVVFLSNVIAVLCNMLGLEAVGWASFVLTFVILAPFALFVGFAAKFMTVERVFAKYPPEMGSPRLALLLSTVIWQFSGFDTVAALSEETKNPRRTFPLAMFLTVLLVTVVYLLPSVAGVCAEPDLSKWVSGAFSTVARELPYCQNGWLSFWISLAGALSSLSLLNVALSCTGRELYAGGRIGAFPFSWFIGQLNANLRHDLIPVRGILIMSLLTLPLSLFDFAMLVEWTGLLTVMAQVIQIVIFIMCRIPKCMARYRRAHRTVRDEDSQSMPSYVDNAPFGVHETEDGIPNKDLENRFIICGGWFGVVLTVVPLASVSVFMCVTSGWKAFLVSLAFIAGMFVLKGIDVGIRYLVSRCKWKRKVSDDGVKDGLTQREQ